MLVVIYTWNMTEDTKNDKPRRVSKRTQLIVLPVMALIAAAAVLIAIVLIIAFPSYDPKQQGVGANGFRSALIEQGADLGASKLVTKDLVAEALGSKAKSVSDAESSKVLNLNGIRSQSVKYDFVREDGKSAVLYADIVQFNNSVVMDSQNILKASQKAGDVQGKSAYFLHAQTLGQEREHRMIVIDGLTVYKYVISQPVRKVTIPEVSSLAVLKNIAQKANY